MKKITLLLLLCCLCTACGTKDEVNRETGVIVSEEIEVTKKVSPLPSTIDINALDNCTVAVSLNEGDIFVDEAGEPQLKVTVYDMDLYDMVDIANLKEGDTIVIQGSDVLVETMERTESGLLLINGGMENDGYDLWHNDSGVYFEQGYSDTKSYYAIGEATLQVSENFDFADSSDPDKGEAVYHADDLLKNDSEIVYHFTPNNTKIVIENGEVTHLIRVYTP